MIDLVPLGDRAFLARFPDEPTARAWVASLRRQNLGGVVEMSVAYRSAAVYLDPDADLDALETILRNTWPDAPTAPTGREILVPTLYDGADLDWAATQLGLTVADLIDAHGSTTYEVFALGFQPGFPYAGYLPPALRGLPRRPEPRKEVPPGSVAIVGTQTAIYPNATPGGWHLLGRTPCRVVDMASSYFPISPGDRLRFVPIVEAEFRQRQGQHL